MQTKYDLKRMLREIDEETRNEASSPRTLTQEEIRQRVAAKKTAMARPQPELKPPKPV